MALPMLQVGAVLTNLVCTKVPILARPHCYRDNADRYPHKFKCCPYNYVFVNYDRICSCVPKKYAQTLRNEQRYRQQKYNSPSYQKTGYRRVSNYGSQRSKNYGYATKSSTKQSRYRQTPSLNARRKGSYPEPSESISNSVKVTSIKRRYKQNSNPVKFKSIRRKTTSNSLKRTQHVPTNTKSRRNNLRQRPRKDFTNMRINSVKIPKKTVSKVPQKRVQVKTQILSSAKVHDRQTKPKSDNSDKKLIRNVGSSIVATNQRKGSRVKHISPPKRTSASFVKNAKSTKKNLPSEFRQRQYKENVSKIKNIKNDVINHVTQTLISDTKTSQSSGNIPIYYLNYNLKNGIVVQMPVIYEYHVVLPQGIDRAIPMPGNKGYLVPISIYVATSGRFVFNPVILRRHPSLLSHIRLARQRGISIKPIPLRQDTIQSNELSTYLNARSHQFDDILIDHPVPVDPLHDVVPLEAQDHAPQSHFIGVNHRHINNNVQRQNNGVVFGFDNTQNQPQHFPHSRVVKHSKDKTSQPFENINTFFDNATLNGLPNRNSVDPKLQSLRVLSNKDFVDKSSRIKQTFNPNWIPNLDLFQMLTNGQRLNENHPTHIQSKQNIQKTFKNHYVDLHNIISNIPLDSHFDLKTDILGRPIPDIPGPLSLRRQSQGKNHRLHFLGTHKGPVGFPSNNSPPRRAEIMLPETLHLVNTGIPQISESSVPLASSGFADVNVAKSFITKLAEQRMSKRNPTETISVIQKDPFLTKQNKMTLKFQGPETQNLNHQLSNPLAGIAGSTNSMTPIETTLHTGKGTGNIVVQTETGKNATTLAKTITHIGKINANIKGSSNMIGNNIGAFEIPIVQTKTRNTKLQNMLIGNVAKVLDPLSVLRNNQKTLKTTNGLTGTNTKKLIQTMINGQASNLPNSLHGMENPALMNSLLGGSANSLTNLKSNLLGQTGVITNPIAGVEHTASNINPLIGGHARSSTNIQTGLHVQNGTLPNSLAGQTGSIPNPSAGMAKTDAKLDALMGRFPAGSTALQTNLQGLTSSIPNPFSGTENTAIKLNLLKEGSSSNSKNSQTNLQGRIGHIPNPLVGANNPTVNLNTLVGRLQVPSTNLQTNVHGKMGHSPNPMAGIKATTANDLNQLKGLPTSSAANSVGKTDHLPNSVSGIETPAVKFNTLFDIPASNSMKLQTNLQRLIGSIPNPLAGTAKTVANVNALLGSPKSQTNVQGQSGPISNPKAIHDHTAVKHDQGMRSPAETSVKLQLDLQTQSNGIPNTVSNIKNAAVTMNRFHVTHQPVASSTKLIKQIGNLPNPMTGMGKTAVKLRNSNRKPETSTGTMHKLQRQTNNPPNPLSEFGNTAPKSETLIGIGQPALNSVHLELNSPRHTGNVKNLLSGMGNNAVVLENPIGQSEIGITNTFEQLNGHARVIPPQSASVGRINSGLTDNSLRNRMFLRENVNMPIQSNKFKKIPFNPRLLAKQNPFTYRTFFNLSPNGPNTGSSSDRNGVIGIINGNTKIYPIPIFPGAINTKMGEPVFQTGNGFDIFSGQEFSPFIDPTTNLPVGFTVKKFNNEVGGVVDLLQKDKPMASDGRKTINVRAKQPKKENGVIRFLQNDAVIKEIVTVLRRKKKTLGPNKNELFIPPEIIGEKSRNDIVMYLEDVKSSKSLSRKPSNDSVPKDLVKLLKNPVFVRYIDNKTQETTPNTVDLSDPRKLGLIFDRISGSRKPTAIETKTNMTSDISFTKSNTKVLNSKSKESMVFLTAKTVPPLIQKPDAEVLFPADPVITLPPVPVLKFDSIELNHQKPLKMNLTKDLCQGCIIDGGLGYANHPSSCERFIVCYPGEGGKLVPIEQQCPHGLFWSQKALTCRLPKDVLCPYDICLRKKGKHQYPHEENCLSYWECQEGYSVPKCCPSGTSFKEGQGCVSNDGSCKSRCPLGDSEIQPVFWQGNFVTSLLGECDRRAVPGSRNKYERHVYYQSHAGVAGRIQQEWMLQECSPGTEFHPEVCDCRVSGDPAALNKIKHVCSPDVYLPFTHNLKDESSSRTHVRADNVSLATSGSACFIGRSALAMPKFANMELGSYLYVKLTYRHMSSSPKNEVLVYNGDCERKPSLILGSTADGNFVSVVTTSGEQHTLHVKSSVPASEWRTVSLVIDNGHIRVTSDSQTEQKNTFGVLERAPCGLKLGWGEGYENFNGCIDEFTLYRCRPDGPLV
uniref:Chitin-binding type-2 domain-containing protein n=1 Tax=Magallana gigas TaxID=29159 RepID=A0A8W8MW23_MAGGI